MKTGLKRVGNLFKPTKKKIAIIVILVLCVSGISFYMKTKTQAQISTTPQYNVYSLSKQDLKKEVSVNGTVDSITKKELQSDLSAVVITKVNVKIGDAVKAGDVICTFDSSSIDQKLKSAQNSAGISGKKSDEAVSQAQTTYSDAITTRDTGKTRNAQAVTDTYNAYQAAITARDAANTAYQQAQAVTKDAQNKFNAIQGTTTSTQTTSTTEQTTSNSPLDAAQTVLTSAQADEKEKKADAQTAQAKVDSTLTDYNTQIQNQQDKDRSNEKDVALQKDALDAAQLDKKATASGDSTQTIADLQTQKSKCTVTAPCDGTVTSLDAEQGDVYKGGTIATIQDSGNLRITATVDQYSVSELTNGMPAVVKTDATGDEEIPGTLSFVSPVPKSSTDSTGKVTTSTDYEIHVDLSQQSNKLRLGMNAKTSIILAKADAVYAVPSECIQKLNGQDSITVLVNKKTGKTKQFQVTKGLETDYYVQISSDGLKDNMKVIVPDEQQSTEAATQADASSSLD